MPRTVGLTQADIDARWNRVVELSQRGVPVEQIAEQLGISITHVFRIRARRMGPKTPRRPFSADEVATIEQMLQDGASLAEIARSIGRKPATLSKRWRGRGWDRIMCAEFGAQRMLEQI